MQRIKGNLKPASSARSSGSFSNGFNTGSFGSLVDSASLSPQLNLILKRLSKRDPVSIIKALDDLKEILITVNQQEIIDFLPIWPSFFNRLGLNSDKRVREGVYACHAQLITLAGRQLTIVLKRVIGTWMMGRFDPSIPVQTLASDAFLVFFLVFLI